MDTLIWPSHQLKDCLRIKLPPSKAKAIKGKKKTKLSPPPIEFSSPRKIPCPKCGKKLSRMAMDIHSGHCGKPVTLSVTDFPFVLVPQGSSGNLRRSYYQYYLTNGGAPIRPDSFDWSRFSELEILSPTMTHIGRRSWYGYAVFEFTYTNLVLLETAVRGHATYVVGSNWRSLISLTKSEIRGGEHIRIIHSGRYWLKKVQTALVEGKLS